MIEQANPTSTQADVVGRLDKGQPGFAGGLVDEFAGVVEYQRVFHHAGFFLLASATDDDIRQGRNHGAC